LTAVTELKTTVSTAFFQRFCPDPARTHDLIELYAEFNARYFNGELPVLKTRVKTDENGEERVVTKDVGWDGKYKKLWGTYKPNGRGTGKIKLARAAALDPVQVRTTLLHEMVHKRLDQIGKDDGIKGHGPNFIAEAKRINELCEAEGVAYRVDFYCEPVTQDEPFCESDLLKTTIYLGKDLDVARRMRAVLKAAFDTYEVEI